MDKINRAIVKSQARQMIKGKVFYLFVITFIVLLLTGSLSSTFSLNLPDIKNSAQNDEYGYQQGDDDFYGDYPFGNYGDLGDYGYFENGDNPIENFGFQSYSKEVKPEKLSLNTANITKNISFTNNIGGVFGIIFIPLSVTLAQIYLNFVRRKPDEEFHLSNELGFLFKHTFDSTYVKKLVLGLLRTIIIAALTCLFIVPGVIYYYRTYFCYQLLDEYPDLKPSEAVKLSAKITDGGKTELFVLDLSFIGWYLLGIITLGIGMIYVLPYYMTAQALYYENFRLRAAAFNKVSEDDFLSEKQRFEKYNQPFGYNGYNNANQFNQNNPYSSNQNGQYGNYNPYAYNPDNQNPQNNQPVQNQTHADYINVYYTPENPVNSEDSEPSAQPEKEQSSENSTNDNNPFSVPDFHEQ